MQIYSVPVGFHRADIMISKDFFYLNISFWYTGLLYGTSSFIKLDPHSRRLVTNYFELSRFGLPLLRPILRWMKLLRMLHHFIHSRLDFTNYSMMLAQFVLYSSELRFKSWPFALKYNIMIMMYTINKNKYLQVQGLLYLFF